ncbi:tetratricopeptide repeat protein [Ideonella livida]|uniref:Tetratricopeptide repeat protein n=1 Tax=Ideonella livida TaxID=2707176 RepID=A0A7C9TL64_9BURK|nr:tetratricopeptide repeat protein [Ideonella livida]NDY92244.1 tetratricopeptide repeat protein [Ideonella livida]
MAVTAPAPLPGSAQGWIEQGIAAVRAGEHARAGDIFARLRQHFSRNPWGWIGEGLIDEALHRWPDAERKYRAILTRLPDDLATLTALARVQVKLGRPDLARAALQRLLQLAPEREAARQQLAKLEAPRKVDVLNQLIQRRGLRHYLEYNKPRCELALHEVACAQRTLICLPEQERVEPGAEAVRLRAAHFAASEEAPPHLSVTELASHPGRYDLIFFDPLHVRPEVDQGLKALCRLLTPGGFLVVHDCCPHDPQLVGPFREGAWCGDTYQAFAQFHRHNPRTSVVVDIDYGVGVIVNRDLCLDYPVESGPAHAEFLAGLVPGSSLIDLHQLDLWLDQAAPRESTKFV